MTPLAARHRAHHSKAARALALLLAPLPAGLGACGGPAVPHPPYAQVRIDDYVAVPYAPSPPAVEVVPAPPRSDAVWVDGTWDWNGRRYRWDPGGWVMLPEGARRVRWAVVRRAGDGQLFFAPSSWVGADGAPISAPPMLVRARSRATQEDTELPSR